MLLTLLSYTNPSKLSGLQESCMLVGNCVCLGGERRRGEGGGCMVGNWIQREKNCL